MNIGILFGWIGFWLLIALMYMAREALKVRRALKIRQAGIAVPALDSAYAPGQVTIPALDMHQGCPSVMRYLIDGPFPIQAPAEAKQDNVV